MAKKTPPLFLLLKTRTIIKFNIFYSNKIRTGRGESIRYAKYGKSQRSSLLYGIIVLLIRYKNVFFSISVGPLKTLCSSFGFKHVTVSYLKPGIDLKINMILHFVLLQDILVNMNVMLMSNLLFCSRSFIYFNVQPLNPTSYEFFKKKYKGKGCFVIFLALAEPYPNPF